MQLKKLAAACAIAFAAAPAFAIGAFDAPDVTVFLSGASAPDNFIDGIAAGMFTGTKAAGDWHKYVSGTHSRAYFGTMKSAAPVPASLQGKKVLFIKRSSGGSVFGVDPVARAEGLRILQIVANTAVAPAVNGCTQTAVGADWACLLGGNDPGVATPTGQERTPDFGVSDVGPAMFKSPLNVEFGKGQLSPSEAAKLTVKGVNTLAMGFAVTNAIPDSTEISRAQYGAMLAGNIQDWTQIDPTLAPAGGNQVVVCRRTPGSGTQASYNWYFNNFPCTTQSLAGTGSTPPARMSDSAGYNDGDASGYPDTGSGTLTDPYIIDASAGYTVIENQGSGDVRKCLAAAANGTAYTFLDEQGKSFKVDFSAGAHGAIGVLSVDSLSDRTDASDGTRGARDPSITGAFSFRAMDGKGAYWDSNDTSSVVPAQSATVTGILPTKQNLIDAKYDFAAELTMQYLSTLTGLKKDFADFFIAEAGKPGNNTVAWTAALPPTYAPPTANVAKATRFGNQCAPLQQLF